MLTTKPDAIAQEWALTDEVIRLRRWGTDRIHMLPKQPVGDWYIGSAPTCALRLDDPLVSREHARLVREDSKWVLRDRRSTNGLWLDGARHEWIALNPCIEIGVGGTTLIPESGRSIALRAFVARILGWTSDRVDAVDQALR